MAIDFTMTAEQRQLQFAIRETRQRDAEDERDV
jgi:hypothetical protein